MHMIKREHDEFTNRFNGNNTIGLKLDEDESVDESKLSN